MEEYEAKLSADVDKLVEYAINGHEYILYAVYNVLGNKIVQQGYVDAGYILKAGKYGLTKNTYYAALKASRLRELFTKACIASEDIERMIEYLDNIIGEVDELEPDEESALIFWLFLPYRLLTKSHRRRIYMKLLLKKVFEAEVNIDRHPRRLEISDEIVFDSDFCSVEIITSVEKYAKYTFELKNEKPYETLFYRGHSLLEYALVPGIKRNVSWFRQEDVMYQELLVRCAQNFVHCQTHLEYLVEMQHYGLPTRLLDITENPLVALYFACCSNKEKMGEVIILTTGDDRVRYAKSDTAAILAALPTLSYEERRRLYKLCTNGISEENDRNYQALAGKLASEVKSRNPAFEPRIRKSDLLGHVFVTPIRSNQRIMKQDGSFIICGLTKGYGESDMLDSLRFTDEDNKRLVLVINDKEKILRELDTLSINRATLFPEIDDVAEYLKEKYREEN